MHNRFLLMPICLGLAAGTWLASAEAADLDEVSVKLFHMQKAAAERDPTPQAEYYLAQMYENGLGTQEDTAKARELYQHAADKGLAVAKAQLKELERTQAEDQLERQRASAKAGKKVMSAPSAQGNGGAAQVAAAIDDDAAEAARRAERARARAERKRRAMEVLRKAVEAARDGDPFE